MKYKTILFSILVACAVSCVKDRELAHDEVEISGKFLNISGGTVYLEALTPTSITLTDSATIDDEGTFILTKKIKSPMFYRVRLKTDDFITLVLDSSQRIHLTADARSLSKTYTVSGSATSELLKKFNDYIITTGIKTDSLEKVYQQKEIEGADMKAVSDEIVETYNKIQQDKEQFVRGFIDANGSSIVTLAAINYLNPDRDYLYFKKVDASLAKHFPKSIYTEDFHKRFLVMSKLAPGSMAPEIILNNPEGEQVSLSSLRGQVVLIDFWASWCPPCRKESPNLVKIYKKYHSKGFTIYSVSLDKDLASWTKAIKDDNLDWIHVSDLKFWDSAVVKLYNLESVPFTVLVDKEGRIIGKGLRGKEIEDRLASLVL